MVMLAIVVLGLFSYQRLKVDQFPNIDFPVVVVQADYPGASPEIVESEVSKKVEEAVNSIAGINALTSRSYENQSVVIIEFQLHIDGRKAAEDVREKIAAVRPTFRTEVKEPRVLRFDPASRPIWSLAVLPDAARAPRDDGGGADQLGRPGAEEAAGERARRRLGHAGGRHRREINIYLDPAAMEALGITADQVVAAVRSENQDLPVGAIRSPAQERVVQIDARMQRPEDFGKIIVARKGGAGARRAGRPRRRRRPGGGEPGALQRPAHAAAAGAESQDENTIAVIDGLKRRCRRCRRSCRRRAAGAGDGRVAADPRVGGQRAPHADRGRLLTVLIVFLFLNSWRSTVITGLTLPIALIGTFLFMYAFGFSINMVTLMALSLCVGLLIDDAIVVRENIVRHVQMGKPPYQAAWTARRRSAWRCWPPPSRSSRCSCRSASWAASSASSSTSSASPSSRRC